MYARSLEMTRYLLLSSKAKSSFDSNLFWDVDMDIQKFSLYILLFVAYLEETYGSEGLLGRLQ